MPIVEPSTSTAPVIADDIYMVECIGVDAKTLAEADKFGKTKKFELHLALYTLDGEVVHDEETGEEARIDPLVNQAWSEKAALFLYATAFGIDADPDVPFDTDRLLGKRAQANIKTEKAGSWPKVTSIMPLPKGKAKAPAKVEQIDPDDVPFDAVPSVVNPNGSCNWAQFWVVCKRYGILEDHVIKFAGEGYAAFDGPDAQTMLESLVAKVNA